MKNKKLISDKVFDAMDSMEYIIGINAITHKRTQITKLGDYWLLEEK